MADRASRKFTGRLEISFRFRVNGDSFVGTESVRAFDAAGNGVEAPSTPGQLEGKRVTIPLCVALRAFVGSPQPPKPQPVAVLRS